MMYEIDQDGKEDVFKANFMNDAMLVYARRKNEVDTLTRTFENLSQCNSTFRLNKSSRLSPKPKQKSAKTFGNINGYSKMTSKGKDISSRLKISGLSTNKTVFNDSKSNIKLLKTQAYEAPKISRQNKMSSQRTGKHKSLNRGSGNKSLNRYKQGCQFSTNQEGSEGNSMCIDNKYAKKNNLILTESRNQHFKKAKSISQENENNLKLDIKAESQLKNDINIKQMFTKISDKSALSMSQSMYDELVRDHKALSKISPHIDALKFKGKNLTKDCKKSNEIEKKNSISLSSSSIYRNQDSRHFSHQQKPIYIANIINGKGDSRIYEENKYSKDLELEKEYSAKINDLVSPIVKTLQRSISESQDKNIPNLISYAPHGGALEKLNNEERLNFLSDVNLSKIDNMSINRRAEKSVDLSIRTGNLLEKHSADFITNKVISNNLLSKYLTKFIGSRDYRTTEEREYEKCTFKPNFVNKKKFKNVNSKLSGYINEKDETDRKRDIALFDASENIQNIVQTSHSVGRGMSFDGRLNSTLCMSDGGFLFRTKRVETSTISVLNEMRSIPTIYSNKSVSGLGGILQFGYAHKYQEKKHYNDIIKPTIKNIRECNTSFNGSAKALSLSIQDAADTSSFFQSKILTPIKSGQGMNTSRFFSNKLTTKAAEIKNYQVNAQEENPGGISPEKLQEIKRIHEIHFKVKRA